MIPSREEQDKKLGEIINKYNFTNISTSDGDLKVIHIKPLNHIMIEYAKWYAEQVIKHCAEVAKFEIFTKSDSDIIESEITNNYYHNDTMTYVDHIEIDKQGILNVINEL